jgi:hypothetical protein
MFASHELALDLTFPVAQARLAGLTGGGWLGRRSEQAYADGLALIRVGPFGSAAGASKLVRVRLLEPLPRDDQMVLPLRWEATGAMGRLFPVLDANLVLTPDGDRCRLALMGAYRPPLGTAGAALDRVMLHRAASATVRALLSDVAGSLLAPDGALSRPPQEQAGPAYRDAAGGTAAAAGDWADPEGPT